MFCNKTLELLSNIFYCLKLSWNTSKTITILRLLFRVTVPLLTMFNTFLSKSLFNIIGNPSSSNIESLYFFSFSIIIMLVIQMAISKISNYIAMIHQEKLTYHITNDILKKSLNSEYSLFDDPKYYDALNAAIRDLNAFSNTLWCVFDVISSFVNMIVLFAVFSQQNMIFSILIVFTTFPSAIVNYYFIKKMYFLEQNQVKTNRWKEYFFDIGTDKDHAYDVRLFGLQHYILDKYKRLWKALFFERRALIKKRSIITIFIEFLPEVIVFSLNLQMCIKVFMMESTIGDFTLCTGLASQLVSTILLLFNSITTIADSNIRMKTVTDYYAITDKLKDIGTLALRNISKIEFDSVVFTYPNTEIKILDNLSFTINSGEKIALVGVNGSGKSTIIKLLIRLYSVDSGKILINDKNINEYSLVSLRKCFSCYFQNGKNYCFSIADNVTISKDNIRQEREIYSVLNDVELTKKLEYYTNSIDTYLSKLFDIEGIELSGGEHQKLALARALYRSASVLILDEPSSSLDPEAEYKILNRILSRMNGGIVILTSHKFSNIVLADRILVLEKGTIIEDGDLNSLLSHSSRFSSLYSSQIFKQ